MLSVSLLVGVVVSLPSSPTVTSAWCVMQISPKSFHPVCRRRRLRHQESAHIQSCLWLNVAARRRR